MTESETPSPTPAPSTGRSGPPRMRGHRARAGGTLLRRRQEELIRYEMGLLETPFVTIRQDPIELQLPSEFVGSTGRVWKMREREVPVFRGLTSIEQMVLRPSDPGEPRRWTRFAAMVVLGLT